MGNLEDFFEQQDNGSALFKGGGIIIGTGSGTKSVVFQNDVGEIHLEANPAAGTATIMLPTSGGTALLSGQAVQGLGVSTLGNSAGSTGTTIGTVVLAGGNQVTLSQSTAAGSLATVTISGANAIFGAGVSTGGNTSGTSGTVTGTLVLAGGNNVTLSQSTNATGATITISGANAILAAGISTGGNTSGTSGTVTGTLVLAGGSNVTLSQSTNASGATITISAATAAGTGVAGIGVSTGGNTSGNTGTTQGTYVLAGGNNITLSQVTAAGSLATVTISAANSGTVVSGIGVSTGGNTSGNTGTTVGTVVFAGGNQITLSQSTAAGSLATITVSGANAIFGAGISTGGNTSGTSGTVSGTLVLAGGNNITLSQSTNASGATVTISGPTVVSAIGVSTGGNTAGTTGTTLGTLVLAGGGDVTLSQSTAAGSLATITISGGMILRSFSWPDQLASTVGSSDAGLSLVPIQVPFNLSATKAMLIAAMSGASQSTGAVTFSLGLYTLSGSTASLASSASRQLSWTSGSTTSVSSAFGGVSGTQYITLSLGTWNITPGDYLFGFYGHSANAGTWTFFGPGQTLSIANALDTNQTNFWLPGFSTSSFTSAFPASINITNTNYVRSGASAYRQVGFLLQGTG